MHETSTPRSSRSTHVLLVHPLGYSDHAADRDVARLANVMPPLGLASLAAWLDQKGFRTTLVDCFAQPDSQGRIAEILRNDKPEFLGLSCTTSTFLDGVRLAQWAKTLHPAIRTV
ncbi:MAG: cobalamin B12-binding domain-containing protein, partial [Kiritimatiellia bacterium]|nr:cobalamin B12-binding domain-containing protein [Kiritimatiellia bacterium]